MKVKWELLILTVVLLTCLSACKMYNSKKSEARNTSQVTQIDLSGT